MADAPPPNIETLEFKPGPGGSYICTIELPHMSPDSPAAADPSLRILPHQVYVFDSHGKEHTVTPGCHLYRDDLLLKRPEIAGRIEPADLFDKFLAEFNITVHQNKRRHPIVPKSQRTMFHQIHNTY